MAEVDTECKVLPFIKPNKREDNRAPAAGTSVFDAIIAANREKAERMRVEREKRNEKTKEIFKIKRRTK